jgi:lipoprotein-anchoring transpeptidase ErfK/SrfK
MRRARGARPWGPRIANQKENAKKSEIRPTPHSSLPTPHSFWYTVPAMQNSHRARFVPLYAAWVAVWCMATGACGRKPPPGAAPSASTSVSAAPSASAPASDEPPAASASGSAPAPAFGELLLYSTAIETYVRSVSSNGGRVLGYLRVGAAVHRGDAPASTEGCKGGWYAVEPRGFVCANDAATLDNDAHMVALAKPGPARGQPMPWQYARVKSPAPHYYFKIPTKTDMRKLEGAEVVERIERAARIPDPNLELIGDAMEVPPLLAQAGRVPRPIGSQPRLRFWVHTGRADPNTRVAILSHFIFENRHYVITSQLDLIPLDRLTIIRPSTFHGVELKEGQALPVAFVRGKAAVGYKPDDAGNLTQQVPFGPRQGMTLTGQERKEKGSTLLETTDGAWVPSGSLVVVEARKNIPTFVKSDDLRWLDIDIRSQSLVAYEGKRPVYATLISTGTGFLGDPETTHATPRGVFNIFSKHVSTKMSGDELGAEYQIDDVPYVQYFHKSYALHGAFWHDDFGHIHSHGCVNLAPADAAWVFEFTSPELPKGWHGAQAGSGGTTVFIH